MQQTQNAIASTVLYAVGAVAMFVAAFLPIILSNEITFVDYPNHLARYFILQNLEHFEDLQRFYAEKDGFYPYWAMRLVVTSLASFFDIEVAGRIFVLLAVFIPLAGVFAIHRAIHGHI
ncbi:MAG: hypothetical protein HKN11_00650, partial [Rhizobiales bacterium]|nr:hypothetical protein [Hyphomicrobiales bacterium]